MLSAGWLASYSGSVGGVPASTTTVFFFFHSYDTYLPAGVHQQLPFFFILLKRGDDAGGKLHLSIEKNILIISSLIHLSS